MNTPKSSPGLHSNHAKAPLPSPALLALQEKGLELPQHRNTPSSISPQSNPAYDASLRVSPLSIVSTPSNYKQSPRAVEVEPFPKLLWHRRTSSTGSAETTVTRILNLYTNLSKQSLNSEYEEISPFTDPDTENEEEDQPLPLVHQPKAQAYRDTIAPLLEHQFSDSTLTVPVVPSPMSTASMPTLLHLDADASVAIPWSTPEASPGLQLVRNRSRLGTGPSNTSIQITPDLTPPPPAPRSQSSTSGQNIQKLREKNIIIEVADVRDAESWYDQPLSPVSPEDLEHWNAVRDSQQSAVSPQSPESTAQSTSYFRSLALESLSPPVSNVQTSPDLRSVKIVDGEKALVPSALDLNPGQPGGSRESVTARQAEVMGGNEDGTTKSQHTSLVDAENTNRDLIERLPGTYPTPAPERIPTFNTENGNAETIAVNDISRPGSAFSSSSDSFVIYDTISGQVKAMLRHKFGRKQKDVVNSKGLQRRTFRKKKSTENDKKVQSFPVMTKDVTTAFGDDIDSYKYPYKLTHISVPTGIRVANGVKETAIVKLQRPLPGSSYGSRGTEVELRDLREGQPPSAISGPAPSVDDNSQPPGQRHRSCDDVEGNSGFRTISKTAPFNGREPHPAIPLTKYQKYGVEVWYESNKKKRQKERDRLKSEATKAEETTNLEQRRLDQAIEQHSKPTESSIQLSEPGLAQGKHRSEFYWQINHGRSTSNDSTDAPVTDIEGQSEPFRTASRQGTNGGMPTGQARYNNELFEASGGKKKGFASRLMMSSEEKRKKKVKESITIVGGAKLGMRYDKTQVLDSQSRSDGN